MSMYENVGLTSLDYIEEILHLRKALADVSDECSKAYDKIANFEQQNWVSVKDRLPENNEEVLVWYEYFRYGEYNCLYQTWGIGEYFKNYNSWMIDHSTGGHKLRVIAWMPLPEPPKE